MLKDGTELGTFQYEGSDTVHYYVKNADDTEFEISHRLWTALLQADGTGPLDLPDQGKTILPVLKEHGIVQTSRLVKDDESLFSRFILFPIRSESKNNNTWYRALNAALPIMSLLIFSIGLYLMFSEGAYRGYGFNSWVYYGILIASVIMHEAGHLISGLAYGYDISETGILLLGFVPVGAYVAHSGKNDATKAQRVQFALSGIEADLLIAGICLIASRLYESLSLTFIAGAYINVLLAGSNLLPTEGLDGEVALSEALGLKSVAHIAKKILFNKKHRQKFLHSGVPGYICLCAFAVTTISKVLIWLLIVAGGYTALIKMLHMF